MPSLNYVRSIEILLSNYVIGCLGLLLSRIKLMNADEARLILLITGSVSIPCMFFREVGQHTLHAVVWKPLAVALSVQVVLHILVVALCMIVRKQGRYMLLLRALISTAYPEFLYFGVPLVQTVIGQEMTFVAVQCAIATLLIVRPIHSFYIYFMASRNLIEFDPVSEALAVVNEKGEEEEDELEDGLDNGVGAVQPVEADVDEPLDTSAATPSPDTSDVGIDSREDTEESSAAPQKLWRVAITSIVNPRSICLLLGLIWSASEVQMPIFLNELTNDHEIALIAPGLFCTGVYIFFHPLIRGNPVEVTLYSLVHIVVLPLLAMLFAWAYKLDNMSASAVTLLHSVPCSVTTYHMSKQLRIMKSAPTYTVVWTNILSLAVSMLWVCILNETRVFAF